MPTAKSQSISIALHVAALALLVFLTSRPFATSGRPRVPDRVVVPIAPLHRIYMSRSEEHSGGSNQTMLPARHGETPPKAHHTFIPPAHMENPKLPMAITVAFDSPTIQVDAANIGDPLSRLPNGGLGMHSVNGIGDGCCGGDGDGVRGRPGITSGGRRHNITAPQLLYKVDPEFSEEARKAKFSGMVVLAIEVDANGRATGFRVVQSPGLGLDQKAIEAVKQWRFRPGLLDGKPVTTSATVQVNFRLL